MRRHVVQPLLVMQIEVGVFGRGSLKPGLQISADFGRRILLDQKRGRGVLTEEGEQPFLDAAALDPIYDPAGDLEQALARRFDEQCGALLTHLMLLPLVLAVMQERWPVSQTPRNVDAFPIHAEQRVLA